MKGDDDTVDIGWCDGVLSDGRAFRAELWAQDQITVLTVFFSRTGLENLDELAMKRLMEEEHLVSFRSETTRYCKAALFTDPAGNEFWSVNIVVGDDEEASSTVPSQSFLTPGLESQIRCSIPFPSRRLSNTLPTSS